MSDVPAPAKQLYCALITVAGDTLLLPNSVVTEAVGQSALSLHEGEPRWFAGKLEWNRRTLSAIHFEVLNGAIPVPLTRRARLVVLQAPDATGSEIPLAVVAQGYPHLITVTRDAVIPLPLRAGDDPALVLARVRVGNSEALIPDLDVLRLRIDALGQAAQ